VSTRTESESPFPVHFPVVALIASAGGVDALRRVLSPLPPDLPAVVLVLLHQNPTRAGALVNVLRRGTRLRVALAENDGVMRPGDVLVAPPGRHLLVTAAARTGLIDSGEIPPSRPSADLLLATLAVTCGDRALVVVLTGMGHDGQAGVRAINLCGGTVMAQDKVTSNFHEMPAAAIATGHVHQVLGVEEIADAVKRHVES
jgi:chemotaxis response regulator CheB